MVITKTGKFNMTAVVSTLDRYSSGRFQRWTVYLSRYVTTTSVHFKRFQRNSYRPYSSIYTTLGGGFKKGGRKTPNSVVRVNGDAQLPLHFLCFVIVSPRVYKNSYYTFFWIY